MAKQVFESRSLSEYIFAFSNQGYDEHKERLHQVFGEMFQENFHELLEEFYHWYYENWMRHDETPHIVQCLQITYDDEKLRSFAQSMRWCRCTIQGIRGCDCRRLYPIFVGNGLA